MYAYILLYIVYSVPWFHFKTSSRFHGKDVLAACKEVEDGGRKKWRSKLSERGEIKIAVSVTPNVWHTALISLNSLTLFLSILYTWSLRDLTRKKVKFRMNFSHNSSFVDQIRSFFSTAWPVAASCVDKNLLSVHDVTDSVDLPFTS